MVIEAGAFIVYMMTVSVMLVFRGAEVYPGDGPPFRTDVGVADGKIAAIGDGLEGDVLDATGAMLCPGFIDLHAHSALAPFDDPLLAPKILQGFTTEVICPDGLAPAPVARLAARGARTCARSKGRGRRSGRGRASPSTSTRSTRRGRR